MAYFISCVSQKGGVGKSSISQLVADEYGRNKYEVLIADMDRQQKSSIQWFDKRNENNLTERIKVQSFETVAEVVKLADQYDLIIFDGAPHATSQTLEMSMVSDLVILPTGPSEYDMKPQVKLANELTNAGVLPGRIVFVFNRVGDSERENKNAIKYITQAEYNCIETLLPDKTSYRYAAEAGKTFSRTLSGSLNTHAMRVWSAVSSLLLKQIK